MAVAAHLMAVTAESLLQSVRVTCQHKPCSPCTRLCAPALHPSRLQLFTGSVSQLEQLLPQVAYGNIMAENPVALTPAHFRQLLMLGQACLDYLHAICCATSKVLVRGGCRLRA